VHDEIVIVHDKIVISSNFLVKIDFVYPVDELSIFIHRVDKIYNFSLPSTQNLVCFIFFNLDLFVVVLNICRRRVIVFAYNFSTYM